MNTFSKIKQYGYLNSLRRLIKILLRKIGIHYESFWYMTNRLNSEEIKERMQKFDYSDVRELRLEDFKNAASVAFTDAKIKLIEERVNSGKYWSFGVFDRSTLIYSCWITTSEIIFPCNKKVCELGKFEGLLEDAYCHPDYRGKSLHSKMNLYRLLKLHEKGRKRIIAIVLSENIPAIKSQLKSGFVKEKKLSFLQLFGKNFFIEKS